MFCVFSALLSGVCCDRGIFSLYFFICFYFIRFSLIFIDLRSNLLASYICDIFFSLKSFCIYTYDLQLSDIEKKTCVWVFYILSKECFLFVCDDFVAGICSFFMCIIIFRSHQLIWIFFFVIIYVFITKFVFLSYISISSLI